MALQQLATGTESESGSGLGLNMTQLMSSTSMAQDAEALKDLATLYAKNMAKAYASEKAATEVEQNKILVLGDSLGAHLSDSLQEQLGSRWIVQPYLAPCASAFADVDRTVVCGGSPYEETQVAKMAQQTRPAFVVIMLGPSDAARDQARTFDKDGFSYGYGNIIRRFQHLTSKPMVMVMSPPPMMSQAHGRDSAVVNRVIPEVLPRIAEQNYVTYLDGYSACGADHPHNGCITDGIHLQHSGGCVLASLVMQAMGQSPPPCM